MIDFEAEREKRRSAKEQKTKADEAAHEEAIKLASSVMEAIQRDLAKGREEKINASRQGNIITLKKDGDTLKIEVKDDSTFDIHYLYGKTEGYIRAVTNRTEHAENSVALAELVDIWRGLPD